METGLMPPIHWRARSEEIRGEVVRDPTEVEFLAILGRQLGIATTCPNCLQRQLTKLLGDREISSYGAFVSVTYHWDIEIAQAIIAHDSLAAIELAPEVGWQLLRGHDATLDHVNHLPEAALAEPIILADALPNAQCHPYTLIDGTHRLLRLLRDGGPIRAFVLDRSRSLAAQVSEDDIVRTGLTLFDRLSRIVRV